MSVTWRKFLGAVLLVATMGFASCMALFNVRADASSAPVSVSAER